MNTIQQQDIQKFAETFALKKKFNNSIFYITGATGLIGSSIIHCLLALQESITIYAPVRNINNASAMYSKRELSHIKIMDADCDLEMLPQTPDYIIHCAAPTNGKYMNEHPVETYNFIIDSTRKHLDYCLEHKIKGMVNLSSLESYGQNFDDKELTEDYFGYIDIQSSRSSYPMAKKTMEYACSAYAMEYGIPVKIARLTQTFGAGISMSDNRVFAQFAKSIISNTDIVIHTTGNSSKPYCYTMDCVSAILYILLKGSVGQVYNVANPKTYISIKDLAKFLQEMFNPNIKIVTEFHPEYAYAPETKLNLSVDKLYSLGWEPQYGLKEMFERLILSIQEYEK